MHARNAFSIQHILLQQFEEYKVTADDSQPQKGCVCEDIKEISNRFKGMNTAWMFKVLRL